MPKSRRSTIRPHQQREDRIAALNAQLSQELATRAQAVKERVEMEHRLQEMRERFESGFVNAPIGMAAVDMNGAPGCKSMRRCAESPGIPRAI